MKSALTLATSVGRGQNCLTAGVHLSESSSTLAPRIPLNPSIQTENRFSVFAGYFADLAKLDLSMKLLRRVRRP